MQATIIYKLVCIIISEIIYIRTYGVSREAIERDTRERREMVKREKSETREAAMK